nr:phospholipase B1, membrane-associated-like [Lytechinus pictus]
MASLWLWILMSAISIVNGDIEDDFRGLYEIYDDYHLFLGHISETTRDNIESESVGMEFNCPSSVSPEKPTSVHKLRPGDINVVAGIGDSLSTAYAAGAPIFLPVMLNYWGVSASIGGDKSLSSVGTLPNILRKYNPDILGYSTGEGIVFTQPKSKSFNHAVVGAKAKGLPKQARKLIDDLRAHSDVDMENDWKFITLFIGGNDLCSGCSKETSEPQEYLAFIDETLRIFHDEVPRAIVNLVGVLNAYILPELDGSLKCNLVHSIVCSCLHKDGGKEAIYERAKEYQRVVQEHIESGKFDDKDDFTVVYQPFFHETSIPKHADGSPDSSYFASDCFHLSQKGQAAQATANWNGLFEPVGSKRLEWVPGEKLNCPSVEFPYIYTNVNSKSDGLQHGYYQSDVNENPNQKLSKQTVIIVGVIGGVMLVIIIAAIVVRISKKPNRLSLNGSYQRL